jgi:lambda family phage portal protein
MSRRLHRIELGSPTLNEAFEELRADYDVCKSTRFRRTRAGVSGTGRSADYHFRSETQWLRAMELAYDIDRNDIVVGQAVDRFTDNIIQDGFVLDPQTEPQPEDDRLSGKKKKSSLDDDLAARWKAWAEEPDACDLAGEHDFHGFERLTLRSVIVAGDIIHLPIADAGALEACEAYRCRTPTNTIRNVVLGVLLDEATRKREEYWLTKEDIGLYGSLSRVSDVRRYPARQRDAITNRDERAVIHCYHPKRISQTRGMTAFAPLAMATEHHDDLQFAQLIKARIAASYAILEEIPMSVKGGAKSAGMRTGERDTETLEDGETRTLEGVGPGMRYRSRPGGKLVGFSPNVPNPEFFEHSLLILTLISVNLGLPVQLLLLDPKQTNFSGWRGAMDQARLGFRKFQRWLATCFHAPVYRWKVRQWMSEDRALEAEYQRIGRQIFRHRWNRPRWPYIEPLTDSQAGLLRVRNLQTSPRRLSAENGFDLADIRAETIADNTETIRQARTAAVALNKEFKDDEDPVSWRDVLCLPTPDRVTATISDVEKQERGQAKERAE